MKLDFAKKKVLVTGAGGFIGSHLTEALVAQGASVTVLIKYNSRNDWGMLNDIEPTLRQEISVQMGNICDMPFVRHTVEQQDYVFHLAALIGIPYSYLAPQDYVMVNIQGTLNILQACLDQQVPRLIHTSTSEAYGTAQYVPIDEQHPLQGQSPYSASKIAADKLAESYYKSFDLPVTTVRPFNTFGPRQSARAFIPTAISQALTQDHLQMGSLEPIRDLTYVKDTVNGFLHAAQSDVVLGDVVNLGVGSGDSIGTVVQTILKILNKSDMPILQDPQRIRPAQSEVQRLISNNAKVRELCHWEPQYSLEEGLKETIRWVEKNIHLFKSDEYIR